MQLPIGETKNDKAAQNLASMNAEDSAKVLTAPIGEAIKTPTDGAPKPGDSTGTDDVHTPAAESPEETRIRKFFNALDVNGRKEAFGLKTEDELSDDRTKLPYKRLPETDREIIRKFHAATVIPF